MSDNAHLDAPTTPAAFIPSPVLDVERQAKLYGKFAKVMADVRRLEKSKRNEQQKFNYTGIEDVKDLIRPLLAKHGIGYSVRMTGKDVREQATKSGSRFVTSLKLEFKFVDSEGGGVEVIEWEIEASDYGDFAITKGLSMGLKYLFMTMFAISTGDELDPDAGNQPPPSAQDTAPTEEMMGTLLVMYKKLYPATADKPYPPDDVILGMMFDRAAGEGSDYTLANYNKVLQYILAKSTMTPVQTQKEQAQAEAEKATKAKKAAAPSDS